jgi:hypothetical protein
VRPWSAGEELEAGWLATAKPARDGAASKAADTDMAKVRPVPTF